MALNADAILKHAGTHKTKEVHVPAWADESGDDVVLVRGMTMREFEINQARLGAEDGKATAALVARCVVTGDGRAVFNDSHVDRIAELGFAELNRIGQVISELSGLTDGGAETLGKSEIPPSDKPSSESPETSGSEPSPS